MNTPPADTIQASQGFWEVIIRDLGPEAGWLILCGIIVLALMRRLGKITEGIKQRETEHLAALTDQKRAITEAETQYRKTVNYTVNMYKDQVQASKERLQEAMNHIAVLEVQVSELRTALSNRDSIIIQLQQQLTELTVKFNRLQATTGVIDAHTS